MKDFRSRWKSSEGKVKALNIISALKVDGPLDEFLIVESTDDGYGTADRDFSQLFDVRGLEIQGCEFSACSLSYLNLSYCKFVNCKFLEVNFFNSRVHEARFDGCTFQSCRLEALYGVKTVYIRSTIDDCSFNSCYLIELCLDGTKVANCDFSSSRLVSPKVDNAIIDNCDFSWAKIAPTKNFIRLFKDNRTSLNLRNIEWLSPDGKAITDPLKSSLFSRVFNRGKDS